MEIKGSELEFIINDFARICNSPVQQINDKQFKLSYRLKKISDKLRSAFNQLDKERIELVKKYGVEDKVKKSISVSPERMPDFKKEWDKKLDALITIDFEPIPMDLLVSANLKINLIELTSIEKFIEKI